MKRIIQTRAITLPLLAVLALVCLSSLGCNNDPEEKSEIEIPPYGTPEHYGYLPQTSTARNPYLNNEIERIEKENGLPKQLTDIDRFGPDGGGAGFLVPELKILFGNSSLGPKYEPILRSAEKLYPKKDFKFDSPEHLDQAIEFRKRYDTERQASRKIADRNDFRLHANLLLGMFAELKFIDVVWTCAYLEAFQAAEALYKDNDPDEAIVAVAYMLRWATLLGNEPHLVARLEAAYLRTEALHILIAILHSKNANADTFQKAYTVVMKHINLWPDESDALRGERAVGMHTYEVARNSDLNSLLEPDEYAALAEAVGTDNLDRYIYNNINTDELFYLNAMRRIIDSISLPYHERQYLFTTIEDELNQVTIEEVDKKGKKRDRTVLADKILLPNIEQSQIIIAEDRANWEALALAIATALNLPNKPSFETNPLTGKLYQVVALDDSVAVYNIVPIDENRSTSIQIPIPKSIRPLLDTDSSAQPGNDVVPNPESPMVPQPGDPIRSR